MRSNHLPNATSLKRCGLALVAMVALVFVAGVHTRDASAQAPALTVGGPYQTAIGQPLQLSAVSYIGAPAAASWSFSDGVTLPGLNVVRAFFQTGVYSATLTVTDSSGLNYSATTSVSVLNPFSVSPYDGAVLIGAQIIYPSGFVLGQGILPGQVLFPGQIIFPISIPVSGSICEDALGYASHENCPTAP